MPTDIVIWNAATHTWRAVSRPDPHGPFRFAPVDDAMAGELARRAIVSAMRLAAPGPGTVDGPSAWHPAVAAWD